MLRKGNWQITVALYRDHAAEQSKIINLWPGLYEDGIYGLAIDLGSTTVAAHLTNLVTGEVVESSGLMNPQIRFGEDLMSRVSYSMMNKNGDQEMTRAVRDAINTLAVDIAQSAELSPHQILEIVFVCNPVMHHLLVGVDPVELGQAPFALATSDAMHLTARDLDLTDPVDHNPMLHPALYRRACGRRCRRRCIV